MPGVFLEHIFGEKAAPGTEEYQSSEEEWQALWGRCKW